MSQINISSTGWLAISLRNGTAGVFNLNNIFEWQYLKNDLKDEEINNSIRSLIKFSPNGQYLVFNGLNQQIYVYIQSNFEITNHWWMLQQIIIVKNSPSALELNDKFIFIADINGDIYQIDLISKDNNQYRIISSDNCIIKNITMVLDMIFFNNDKNSFLITANQNNKIHLINYPNTSHTQSYCLGHTEFVSHIKLIDNNYLLSASGDGTLRLWHLPDCKPLVLLHSKTFSLTSKQIFYTELYDITNEILFYENYLNDMMPEESPLNLSSIIDYSIWKMNVISYFQNIYIAFSIYSQRSHTIYLTSLTNIKQLANEQRKLIFDISYGNIIDYYLLNESNIYLYILFDSNIILKIDIISILLCNEKELFAQSNDIIQKINNILTQKDFHLINNNNNINYTILDNNFYKQLFKNQENNSKKRKLDKTEDEQRNKQISPSNDNNMSLDEFF